MLRKSFNEKWFFSEDKLELVSELVGSTGEKAKEIMLPHDAMIFEHRNKDNSSGNSGGFYPGGNYVYTKKYLAPVEMEEKTVILGFEGVYNKARVYVNGDFVTSNNYGYTGFYADITPYLQCGAENTIM